MLNKHHKLSNAYNQSQKQKRNAHAAAQGTKVATFLQSKFRMGKAKKRLNELRTHQLITAKERNITNASENASVNRTKENNLQGIRNKLSMKNKLNSMTNSVKRLAYPNRSSRPKNRSKSSLEKAMNSTRLFFNRKTPHWITLGAKSGHKSRHVKPVVRRVAKQAPK
jgi:hypothetical protein